MHRRIWRNKWFILVSSAALFWMATATRVMAAGTDQQLTLILSYALQGLEQYFDFLLNTMTKIW